MDTTEMDDYTKPSDFDPETEPAFYYLTPLKKGKIGEDQNFVKEGIIESFGRAKEFVIQLAEFHMIPWKIRVPLN